VQFTTSRRKKNEINERECHFPLHYIKVNKQELKRMEKEHYINMKNYKKKKEEMKKMKKQ